MAGRKNLIKAEDLTPDELRERARAGGIASGKARREKKAMRETLDILLSMPMKDGEYADVGSIQSFAAIKGKNISVQEAILIAQVQKAMKGETTAAEYVRDTMGEKPGESVEMTMNLPVFFEGEDELEE